MKTAKEIVESFDLQEAIKENKSYWYIENFLNTKENMTKIKELAGLKYFILNCTTDFKEVFYDDCICFMENESDKVSIWTYTQYLEFGCSVDKLYIYKKGDEE